MMNSAAKAETLQFDFRLNTAFSHLWAVRDWVEQRLQELLTNKTPVTYACRLCILGEWEWRFYEGEIFKIERSINNLFDVHVRNVESGSVFRMPVWHIMELR